MLAIALGTILVLAFYNTVLDILTQPYINICERKPDINATCELNVFSPTEGFTTLSGSRAYGGLVLALPVVLWQIWRFIVPRARQGEEVRHPVHLLHRHPVPARGFLATEPWTRRWSS